MFKKWFKPQITPASVPPIEMNRFEVVDDPNVDLDNLPYPAIRIVGVMEEDEFRMKLDWNEGFIKMVYEDGLPPNMEEAAAILHWLKKTQEEHSNGSN